MTQLYNKLKNGQPIVLTQFMVQFSYLCLQINSTVYEKEYG